MEIKHSASSPSGRPFEKIRIDDDYYSSNDSYHSCANHFGDSSFDEWHSCLDESFGAQNQQDVFIEPNDYLPQYQSLIPDIDEYMKLFETSSMICPPVSKSAARAAISDRERSIRNDMKKIFYEASRGETYDLNELYQLSGIQKPTNTRLLLGDETFMKAMTRFAENNSGNYDTVGAFRAYRKIMRKLFNFKTVLKEFPFQNYLMTSVPTKWDKPNFTGPFIAGQWSDILETIYKIYNVKEDEWFSFLKNFENVECTRYKKVLMEYILEQIEKKLNSSFSPKSYLRGQSTARSASERRDGNNWLQAQRADRSSQVQKNGNTWRRGQSELTRGIPQRRDPRNWRKMLSDDEIVKPERRDPRNWRKMQPDDEIVKPERRDPRNWRKMQPDDEIVKPERRDPRNWRKMQPDDEIVAQKKRNLKYLEKTQQDAEIFVPKKQADEEKSSSWAEYIARKGFKRVEGTSDLDVREFKNWKKIYKYDSNEDEEEEEKKEEINELKTDWWNVEKVQKEDVGRRIRDEWEYDRLRDEYIFPESRNNEAIEKLIRPKFVRAQERVRKRPPQKLDLDSRNDPLELIAYEAREREKYHTKQLKSRFFNQNEIKAIEKEFYSRATPYDLDMIKKIRIQD